MRYIKNTLEALIKRANDELEDNSRNYRVKLGQRNGYYAVDKYVRRDQSEEVFSCETNLEVGTAKEVGLFLSGLTIGLSTYERKQTYLKGESKATLLPYIGDCFGIRESEQGEIFWKDVTSSSIGVPLREFLEACDLTEILDDRETLVQWLGSSPVESSLRLSLFEGQRVYWIKDQSGFEYFWYRSCTYGYLYRKRQRRDYLRQGPRRGQKTTLKEQSP